MACNSSRCRKQNLLAGTILTVAAGVLYTSFDPVPAGESPAIAAETEAAVVEEFLVPLPPEAADLPVIEVAEDDSEESTVTAPVVSTASTLSNYELVEYSLLLLKDGAEYLRQFKTYSAVFHKQERLGGDLSEIQNIDLKIQQSPHFAVYMKWRNGDRGRQLLYSTEYEDGDMVVKLGGFKGRLLPGIKLNPNGTKAREESRHPVTKAGLLGMVEKMINHRRRDLKQGYGLQCTRLPNQEFDGRDCLCFLYEYESPEVSGDYRKSVILIDAQHHIPVMARNYTWAAEADNLSPEELDALTLVENYSFTGIDFNKTLTAKDFSRDNRRYRM